MILGCTSTIQSSSIEQAVLNLSKVVRDFVGEQKDIKAIWAEIISIEIYVE